MRALADGTLSPERRAAVEEGSRPRPRSKSCSSASDASGRDQAASERARAARPSRLGRSGGHGSPADRVRWMPRLAFGGVAAAVATVALVLVLAGGPAAPTVADAAALPPCPQRGRHRLASRGAERGWRPPWRACRFRTSTALRLAGRRSACRLGRWSRSHRRLLREERAADRPRDRVRRRSAAALRRGRSHAPGSSIGRCARRDSRP